MLNLPVELFNYATGAAEICRLVKRPERLLRSARGRVRR